LRDELGPFNVFRLDPDIGKGAKPSSYRKRDWYNITLVYIPEKHLFAEKNTLSSTPLST
jgi:AraC family transcriptional regulator, transcriptional activator of pobA